MASEYCLTCGHTKNSHISVEIPHVLKKEKKLAITARLSPVNVNYSKYNMKYYESIEVILIYIIFMIMTAVWCKEAYYLVNHPLVVARLRSKGHINLPFALIGFGIYILLDSFTI